MNKPIDLLVTYNGEELLFPQRFAADWLYAPVCDGCFREEERKYLQVL